MIVAVNKFATAVPAFGIWCGVAVIGIAMRKIRVSIRGDINYSSGTSSALMSCL